MDKVTKNTIWNLVGNVVYFVSQWLMTVLVVRISGDYKEAGILSVAMSISAIFSVVSNFSVRYYQVSDIDGKYTDGEYVTFRYITCALSMLFLVIYLAIVQYEMYTMLAVICFMLLKIVESLVDVFQGIFQKQWRLDIACKSMIIRGVVNISVFTVTEIISENLVITLLITSLLSLICAFIFDFIPCSKANQIKVKFKNRALLKLAGSCFPLFLHSILIILLPNIPKLFAKEICGEELLGFYSSVATPAVVVQLVSTNIFSSALPLMAEQYNSRNPKLYSTIFKIQGIILALGLCAIVGFSLFGNFALRLIFGEEILIYTYLLIPTVIVSILTAVSYFLTSLFTVIHKNVTMVIAESICVVFTLAVSQLLITKFSLEGINLILIYAYLIFIFVGYPIIFINIFKKMRGER